MSQEISLKERKSWINLLNKSGGIKVSILMASEGNVRESSWCKRQLWFQEGCQPGEHQRECGRVVRAFYASRVHAQFHIDQSELMNSHLLFLVAAVIVKVSLKKSSSSWRTFLLSLLTWTLLLHSKLIATFLEEHIFSTTTLKCWTIRRYKHRLELG